jgi:hypothetical protein
VYCAAGNSVINASAQGLSKGFAQRATSVNIMPEEKNQARTHTGEYSSKLWVARADRIFRDGAQLTKRVANATLIVMFHRPSHRISTFWPRYVRRAGPWFVPIEV